MPNWVYTNMTVSGSREELLAFAKKAKQPYFSYWKANFDENNNFISDKDKRVITEKEQTPDAISFWNFVRPTDEELPYYYQHKEEETNPDLSIVGKSLDDAMVSFEERIATGKSWYEWNIRNWGTKWDVCDDYMTISGDDKELDNLKEGEHLIYSFSTAWSPAEEAFRAIAEQHPNLHFFIHCEEEQGWGVQFIGEHGALSVNREWDIPQSHADYVANDDEEGCVCSWMETEDWFDDCPKDEDTNE